MLTFQELISASPFQYADIIGGWGGKSRSFSQCEVTISSFEQPTLLLLPYTNSNIIQLPDYLSKHNIQGILLYGMNNQEVPLSIVREVDSLHKPVLALTESNSTKIQKKVNDLQELQRMGLFQYIWEQSNHYWLELLNNEGIECLFSRLRLVIGQHLLLVDASFQSIPVSGENQFEDHLHTLKSIFDQQSWPKDETISIINSPNHTYLLFHLRTKQAHYGYILLQEQTNMMIDICIEQITYAIQAIISYFKTNESLLEIHQSYKQQFLHNLLFNNLESEESLITLGKQWNWDFSKPTQLMVMKLTSQNAMARIANDIEKITSTSRSIVQGSFLHSILHPIQGNIVIIIFDSFHDSIRNRKKVMTTLAKNIQNKIENTYPAYQCQIGLGRHYPSNMELYKSFYEAKVALELGRYGFNRSTVQHFEDIGFPRLLSNIPNHLLHEFYKEALEELLLLEKEDVSLYIETLESFYINNGDIQLTAEKLFIHPNTLRKRMKKIETILDVDFNQLDHVFRVFIALTIMKMLN
jgi:sugar diacid utilization regulator